MGQSIDTTFNNIAGFHMSFLHSASNLICGGFIVLFAVILLGSALWHLQVDQEITRFTFLIIVFFAIMAMCIFLMFINT